MKRLAGYAIVMAFAGTALAQDIGYPNAAAALAAMRAKPGVKISEQSGWTVIEDRATLTLWSFTPPGHAAHPAAVRRKVVQEGSNLFIKTDVLCEAPKPSCDAMVADFDKLNGQVRDELRDRKR